MCIFFRIVIALFGFLVILSTGYELCIKLKKDENPSPKKSYNNLTIGDNNNGVELNGIKTISTGDLEIKSKDSQEMSEATEQKTINGSTVVLVQKSNQDLTGQKNNQGIILFISRFCFT